MNKSGTHIHTIIHGHFGSCNTERTETIYLSVRWSTSLFFLSQKNKLKIWRKKKNKHKIEYSKIAAPVRLNRRICMGKKVKWQQKKNITQSNRNKTWMILNWLEMSTEWETEWKKDGGGKSTQQQPILFTSQVEYLTLPNGCRPVLDSIPYSTHPSKQSI